MIDSRSTTKPSIHRLITAVVCGVAFCVWQTAVAQLKVSESVIELHASDEITTIELSNTGKDSIQVTMDLNAVLAPGIVENGKEDIRPANAEILRIEPNAFEIAPNTSQTVTVHHTARNLIEDEIYRLRVTPELKQPQNGMNIRLSYDLLLMIRPDVSVPKIRLRTSNDNLSFVNIGNSNALLSSIQVCDELVGDCQSLPSSRLYTKQILPLTIPTQFNINHTVIKTVQSHLDQRNEINYHVPTVTVSR